MLKDLTGSAPAGAMGGFNAHASNIVFVIFIATIQDPSQNIESSHCITMMEASICGKDMHVLVIMPCNEVINCPMTLTYDLTHNYDTKGKALCLYC